MGYSVGWVATRGSDPHRIRQVLGLRGTGVREAFPESPFVDGLLPQGWHVVVIDRGEHLLEDELMSRLSAGCEAVACFVEEHVMYSAAVAWTNGQRRWVVIHDSEKGSAHLETHGDLPDTFPTVLKEQQARWRAIAGESAGDNLFDIPIDLACSATGYRHDEEVEEGGEPLFEVLAPSDAEKPKPRSWWSRWLK